MDRLSIAASRVRAGGLARIARRAVAAAAVCLLAAATWAAGAEPFAIRSSVPTTLSLQRLPTGVYRLTHSGTEATELTVEGLAKPGDVVYELGADGRPGRRVSATVADDRLTFTIQPGMTYAIGAADAILAPTVKVSLQPDDLLIAGRKSRVLVEVGNHYDSALRGKVVLEAPDDLSVTPRREQALDLKKEAAGRIAFTVSRRELAVDDVLRGKDELKVIVEDGKGQRLETALALRIEDNPLRGGVVIEAESIAAEAQTGTPITIRDDKVNVSGKTFSGWNDKDHWLEWRVNLPRAGRYRLAFRFCVDGHVAHRDFTLDGQYPDEACRDIAFPDTGGWSNEANNWRHYVVADAKGKPVLLDIPAGPHTVRMNPILGDGGCNIDYILLIPVNQ
jgi:hypothetical protein